MMKNHEDLTAAINRSVRSTLRGHPLVEDAVQEAQIAAWERREADPETPLGHLLVSARRKAQDVAVGKQQYGAPHRTPGSGSRKPVFGPIDVGAYGEFAETWAIEQFPEIEGRIAIEQILEAALTYEERVVVEMMIDGYRHAEIAHHLSRTVSWVRDHMPQIRAKLMPYLGDLRVAS
jgi:DNA-directed RNA polymerase specialized sigma24 family protein